MVQRVHIYAQIRESTFNNNLIEHHVRLLRTNEPCLSGRRHYAQPNYRPMISWNAIRNPIDEMLARLAIHRRIKRLRCRSPDIYIFNAKDLLCELYAKCGQRAYGYVLHIFL